MLSLLLETSTTNAQNNPPVSYAEKLGWNKHDKIVIFHVDDAGMSYD